MAMFESWSPIDEWWCVRHVIRRRDSKAPHFPFPIPTEYTVKADEEKPNVDTPEKLDNFTVQSI